MKVLQIYKDIDPPIRGGIEGHVALLCKYLSAHCEVEAVVCSRSGESREKEVHGVRVREVGEWGRVLSAPIAPKFISALREGEFDILHFHLPNPTAVVAYLAARPQGKVIVTYHSDIVRQAWALWVYRPFLNRFLSSADTIMTTSSNYRTSSPILARFQDKCRDVPLGVALETCVLPEQDLQGEIERLEGIYGRGFVLFVGRFRHYKGLRYLIEAMKDVEAALVLAGAGLEEEGLRRQVSEAGLGEKVFFAGEVPDREKIALLRLASIYVLPASHRSEAFGLSMIEAHLNEVPVVATRLGTGVEFVNQDGDTGINVPPRDSRALAEGINRLLGDPKTRSRMGSFARERALKEFTAEKMVGSILDCYRRTLTESQSSTET